RRARPRHHLGFGAGLMPLELGRPLRIVGHQLAARRLRVAAAFLAEAERAAAGRLAAAAPPLRPPFLAASFVSFRPRPDPDLLPPPVSLFTVAQARRSASSWLTPRSR